MSEQWWSGLIRVIQRSVWITAWALNASRLDLIASGALVLHAARSNPCNCHLQGWKNRSICAMLYLNLALPLFFIRDEKKSIIKFKVGQSVGNDWCIVVKLSIINLCSTVYTDYTGYSSNKGKRKFKCCEDECEAILLVIMWFFFNNSRSRLMRQKHSLLSFTSSKQ